MKLKLNCIILLLIIILFSNISFAQNIEAKNLVNDYANIISEQEKIELNTILKSLYDSNAAQYSVVTIKNLEGKDIQSYSLELAQGNLGDKEKNNGLLLLVSLEDRKYFFQIGRGLEAQINDAKIGRVGRTYLVPNFKNNEYGKGIVEASKSIQSILMNNTESEYYIQEENKGFAAWLVFPIIIFIFLLPIFFVIFIPLLIFALKRSKKKSKYYKAAKGAIILFGGTGSRGGFGGSGSGGFGGFGGGSFGGGGAGGSW